jgi:hypothetical protein
VSCEIPPLYIPYYEGEISRDTVLLAIVVTDLLSILVIYVSLLCLKSFQKSTVHDTQEYLLTADDFSLCFEELPSEVEDMVELKAYLWAWVENILNKEKVNLLNQDTGKTDQF